MVIAAGGFALRPAEIVAEPKSVRCTAPLPSKRMFTYSAGQRNKRLVANGRLYLSEIPMRNHKLVKVLHAGYGPRGLRMIKDCKVGVREEIASGLTDCKRFTSGLTLVHPIIFPFSIQSETNRKSWGSVEKETPNKGKFGCDRRFQPIISRSSALKTRSNVSFVPNLKCLVAARGPKNLYEVGSNSQSLQTL